MSSVPRVALFLDFENLYSTLKRRTRSPRQPYGLSPKMDFERLVAYIDDRYGSLAKEDFIVVANFSHYNPQIGGLNRVATVINAQSFLHPRVRRQRQRTPGKKWVIHNYSDMLLAFELGRHVTTRPADIYILGSGDEAFTALGRTLKEMGFTVVFLVADLHSPSTDANIREEFEVFDFLSTQTFPLPTEEPTETEPPAPPPDPVERFLDLVSQIRRTFNTPVPVELARALWTGQDASWEDVLNKARGQGRIDLWEDPHGIPCLSRREERLYGKIPVMEVRSDVAQTARVFQALQELRPQVPRDADRVFWRKALRDALHLSSKESKSLLQALLETGILRDGFLNRPRLTLTTAQALAQHFRQEARNNAASAA